MLPTTLATIENKKVAFNEPNKIADREWLSHLQLRRRSTLGKLKTYHTSDMQMQPELFWTISTLNWKFFIISSTEKSSKRIRNCDQTG